MRTAFMKHASLGMVAFDIDGVIHRGETLLPGAAEALADVLRRGLLLRYVTNNSSQHRSAVAARLAGFGLPAKLAYVLTSGAATSAWLQERLEPGARVLVVGGEGLVRELTEVGLEVSHAGGLLAAANGGVSAQPGSARSTAAMTQAVESLALAPPAAIVVGLDRSFCYDTLALAQAAIMAGALFVATNTDATFPVEGRLLPGGGAIVAALATASGREPVVMGKPERGLADVLLADSGGRAQSILFVGDKLNTDIEMASRAGMRSALVLTGVT
ncbi:MAG: HAD-IIA family hydrolase, partial [Thermoleophilia bacterium]|nr:HAD-IIA family hydrolase [Thermoleophilia bacterium]